jgi:hypothetical protein
LIKGSEIAGTQAFLFVPKALDFVSAVRQIANRKLMLWKSSVQHRFEIAKVLHSFGNRSTDDTDVIAFIQFKVRRSGNSVYRTYGDEKEQA